MQTHRRRALPGRRATLPGSYRRPLAPRVPPRRSTRLRWPPHAARRPAELPRQCLRLATHRERALLKVARDVQRPPLVAEVPLQLAQDGGCRKARELRAAIRVEAIDRFDQPEARHLEQVVKGLVRVDVTPRKIPRQRETSLHQLFPRCKVAGPVVADQKLSFELSSRSTVGASTGGGLEQPRGEGECAHRWTSVGLSLRKVRRDGGCRSTSLHDPRTSLRVAVCPSPRFPSRQCCSPIPVETGTNLHVYQRQIGLSGLGHPWGTD